MLERKVKFLEQKVRELTCQGSHQLRATNVVQKLLGGRLDLWNALSTADSSKDPSKVNDCIDLLQYRYGSAGMERVSTIEKLFEEVVSFLLPMHIRLLIQHPEIVQSVTPTGSELAIKHLLQRSEAAKKGYQQSLERLRQAKDELLCLNEVFQELSNNIRDTVGTDRVAQILRGINIRRQANEDYKRFFPVWFWAERNRGVSALDKLSFKQAMLRRVSEIN